MKTYPSYALWKREFFPLLPLPSFRPFFAFPVFYSILVKYEEHQHKHPFNVQVVSLVNTWPVFTFSEEKESLLKSPHG
jgi:hypothetical protein